MLTLLEVGLTVHDNHALNYTNAVHIDRYHGVHGYFR